ncbi:hypothetical protein [Taibaiella koreensis]|uniref:hypothetical protein n=1 Tax=Taibaiella koreensis TaxID=1268548 RepID=UPI000E5A0EDD|nr:hypothetical protein [Taibaiella koreensis]
MKKKNVGGLLLKKNLITNLNAQQVTGGENESLTIVVVGSMVVCPTIVATSLAICTRGKGCDMPTVGTGDGSRCASVDGKSLCGGRA